jgi:hypothetical protein
VVARFVDPRGGPREVVAVGRAHGLLVYDRDQHTRGDRRLVGQLGADEPCANALVLARVYAADASTRAVRCRRFEPGERLESERVPDLAAGELPDHAGCAHRLELVDSGMSIPELRWRRHARCEPPRVVSVRDVVSVIESYEQVRELTAAALALREGDGSVSTVTLRAELTRVLESPIILNRRLRELVVRTVGRDGVSMSEIAVRCGRTKRDRAGNHSGDTSWLARRLGLLPEGGHSTPTPWIHTEVLGLIARRGLSVTPREAEVL